jgi:flagellar motor switch protein FliN/FliY
VFRVLTTHSPYRGDLTLAPPHARNAKKETNVATLDKVAVNITVVLGTTSMPIHQALRLGRGAIIELDASEEDAVSILANNLPVAKGTVVVNGNRIAVNVAELLPRPQDMR